MPRQRLDKFLADAALLSRRDATNAIRAGRVTVDGQTVRTADYKVDGQQNAVVLDGKVLTGSTYLYVMLNKPAGLVTSVSDSRDKTVMSLCPELFVSKGVFPAGRLDKDTVGLLLLTNDGELTHRMLSPKYHAEKHYVATCDKPFENEDIAVFQNGIMMDGKCTKPARLVIREDGFTADIFLTEGKYHEVKRLCLFCGKTVTHLERVAFASLRLDPALERGAWRYLTGEETDALLAYVPPQGNAMTDDVQ